MKNKFKSTHRLKFQTAPFIAGDTKSNLQRFQIGTCSGIWDVTLLSVDIIGIQNSEPMNGHMRDAFEWIIETARLANLPVVIKNVKSDLFREKLVENWQFMETKNKEILVRSEHCKTTKTPKP